MLPVEGFPLFALHGAHGFSACSEFGGAKRKGLNAAEAAYLISETLVLGFGTTEVVPLLQSEGKRRSFGAAPQDDRAEEGSEAKDPQCFPWRD